METKWNEHCVKVTGNWTGRWLFLAPQYELWIDDQRLDLSGGPRIHPKLEGVFIDDRGDEEITCHIEAEILSLFGIRPKCDLFINNELVDSGRVQVENLLNPILLIFIISTVGLMIYLGPKVLRQYI